jgi:transcriptional regulator GlxA family with amidase domain
MAKPKTTREPRTVALVAFDDAQMLDITGPLEVFGATNRWLATHRGATKPAYALELLSPDGEPVRTSTGVRIVADGACRRRRDDVDTLLVAGGTGVRTAVDDAQLVRFIATTAPRARRFGSVCSGAFLLAAAGLADGRRVATHWRYSDELARRHPGLTVDRDAIFVRDGACITSAGVSAGIDLALALVEQDHDRGVALGVARELVLFLVRSGSQTQFSAHLAAQASEHEPLGAVRAYIAEHPAADLSVPELARRAGLSARQFARVFRDEVGTTPAKHVAAVRLDEARALLERSRLGLDEVAARVGFGSADILRLQFLRSFGITPSIYRQRFAKEAA